MRMDSTASACESGRVSTTSPFSPESYDAAALIMLAMQAAGSAESADFKDQVMNVANAPGEQIFPGELAKALQILADGGDIDYVGASAVELVGPGESALFVAEKLGFQQFARYSAAVDRHEGAPGPF